MIPGSFTLHDVWIFTRVFTGNDGYEHPFDHPFPWLASWYELEYAGIDDRKYRFEKEIPNKRRERKSRFQIPLLLLIAHSRNSPHARSVLQEPAS